jgi:zinc D-Ala-D-Ala carboxypeptidase
VTLAPHLSPHFTLEEMTRSDVATRLGIDNDLPIVLRPNMLLLVAMLERIRRAIGDEFGWVDAEMRVTSGYRSPELNEAVGGRPGSDHATCSAADWRIPGLTTLDVCRFLQPRIDELEIGQLAHEYPGRGGWVHTSTVMPAQSINRVITITSAGAQHGI